MINITTSHTEGVYYYKLFYLAAILIGVAGAGVTAHKKQFTFREFAFIVSTGILSLIIGSKMILFDHSQWLKLFYDHHLPEETGKSVLGAIAGGMLGAFTAGRLCGKKDSVLDLFAVSFPLGMAVQRFGCLFAGCCHGSITSLPWGITYGPGSRPFEEQCNLGIIPANAAHSLAIHPDQVYHIIACTVITFIAWKTSPRWKSPSGKFIFSIILYLTFRFAEEFSRFSLQPEEWTGLKIIQWKVLFVLILLSLVLFFRERKYASNKLSFANNRIIHPSINLKIFFLSLFVLFITLQIGSWLTGDELTIVVFTVFPLCGFILTDFLIRNILTQKYLKTCCLLLVALIMMSQKAEKPVGTPESYTAVNLTSAFGRFYLDHEFNYRTSTGTDCDGNPITNINSDNVSYQHSYGVGGIGVSRKTFYNKWQSTSASLNFFAGRETEKVSGSFYSTDSFSPPVFKNTLLAVNPVIQYDGRGIGLGLGGSFGVLGYDKKDDPDDKSDYKPKENVRKVSLQGRVRFFSERTFFIEGLAGYDAGSMGEYIWQAFGGSRFNSDKFMIKTGVGRFDKGGNSLIVRGEILLRSKFSLSPEFMFSRSANSGKNGYRAALTLQYRYYKKKE